MKTIIAKHPIRMGPVLIAKGEIGRPATMEEANGLFQDIELNPDSQYAAVVFRGKPLLVMRDEIIVQ